MIKRILSEKNRWRFLISRILWRTGLCRLFSIKTPDFQIRFYPSAMACSLWVNANERQADKDFFCDFLKPGDVVVDIGANIGLLTLIAAKRVGDIGKVYAFEPHQKIFKFLENNIKSNKLRNVYLNNIALGAEQEVLALSNKKLDDMNQILPVTNESHIKIMVKKLDDCLPHESIALMKIDVEGYEKFVLQGARKLLGKTACLYFESSEHHFQAFGYSSQTLFQRLKEQGFQIFSCKGRCNLTEISDQHRSINGENLIAIRSLDHFLNRTGYSLKT